MSEPVMEADVALPLTISMDESGTPALAEARFTSAGIAIRGPVESIKSEWEDLVNNERLPRKGTKYSRDQFLALVDFLIRHRIFPIDKSHSLDKETVTRLRAHCENLPNYRKQTGLTEIRLSHYVWAHSQISSICSAIGPIVQYLGPVSSLTVEIDQFALTDEMRAFVEHFLRQFLSSDGGLVKAWTKHENNAILRPMLRKMQSGYQIESSAISVDLKPRGSINQLADAVAALFRKGLAGDDTATDPLDLLRITYAQRIAIGRETGMPFQNLLDLGWQLTELN